MKFRAVLFPQGWQAKISIQTYEWKRNVEKKRLITELLKKKAWGWVPSTGCCENIKTNGNCIR